MKLYISPSHSLLALVRFLHSRCFCSSSFCSCLTGAHPSKPFRDAVPPRSPRVLHRARKANDSGVVEPRRRSPHYPRRGEPAASNRFHSSNTWAEREGITYSTKKEKKMTCEIMLALFRIPSNHHLYGMVVSHLEIDCCVGFLGASMM